MKRYHVIVKFLDDLRYGKFIEASSEEGAIRQFVDNYVYIFNGESISPPQNTVEQLERENEELKSELSTLKAQLRGTK